MTGGATRTGGARIAGWGTEAGGGQGGVANAGTTVLIVTGGAIRWQDGLICRMGT